MYIKEADGWRGSTMSVVNSRTESTEKVDREYIKVNGKWVGLPKDGYEWIRQEMPVVGKWDVVTEFEGKFLAISNDPATIAMSGDGVEWDVQDITEFDFEPTLSLIDPSYPDEAMLFAKGKDHFYIADSNYHGDWWRAETSVFVGNPEEEHEIAITGNWVAAASDGTSNVILEGYMDVDGEELPSDKVLVINWESESGAFRLGQMPSKQYWSDITYNGDYGRGYFMAVAKNSDVSALSVDGLNWTEHKLPRVAAWSCITAGQGRCVALAEFDDIVAVEGRDWGTWEMSSIISAAPWSKIEFDNERFLAISTPHLTTAWSRDGISWNKLNLPVNQEWNDLHSLGGRFLAVGGGRQVTDIAATLDFDEFSKVGAGKTVWVNQVVEPGTTREPRWFSLTGSIALGY